MIDSKTTVRRHPSVVAQDLAEGEGAVLLQLDSGQYHSLNPVGQAVWDLLDSERTVATLVTELRELIEEPSDSLQDDVLKFLEAASERDLVEVV